MSSSDGEQTAVLTGRVILGPGLAGPGETTVAELEAHRSPEELEKVEARFWDRLRTRASAKAQAIIAEALAEAERLRVQAQADGYAQGHAEGHAAATEAAEAAAEAEMARMAASFGGMVETLAGERDRLWHLQREEFLTLLRLAVERTVNVSIDFRRQEILANLLHEALEAIDAKAEPTLTVHPEDEALLRELLVRAKAERPNLHRVSVRVNPAFIPGSLYLEYPEGLVDNTIASRFAEVETVFAHLNAAEASGEDGPEGLPGDGHGNG
ncbi:flagellar assembly protein FliH [Desulfovibrio aerotolerans]|uniref:Flagellar assembly protein FliH n=1 Tax=Solidesulfovibrio aerotolerans TaxID=295255 RepID=A0A7C9MIL8_9BACT|nr:FliH/SctL family protein [Solidesulfovibrio aerotolerans]MYL83248.1 flagellar assembly protein FliH [Solidesulfovibrio aerotolerans]